METERTSSLKKARDAPTSDNPNQASESETESFLARYARVSVAMIYLSVAMLFTVGLCQLKLLISPVAASFIFAAYLLSEGILLTWLSTILYRQHGIKEFRFGIGALLILTTMLAILLGSGSLISSLSNVNDGETNRVLTYLLFWWLLSLLPVLFIAEAVSMLVDSRRRRRRGGSCLPKKESEAG